MKPAFTEKEAKRLERALKKRWSHLLSDEIVRVRGTIEDSFVQVTFLLENADKSLHYPMECRVETGSGGMEPYKARDLALDFLDWYLGEYLSSGREVLLKLDWEEVSFGEYKVHARGDVRNKKLEDLADALLDGKVTAEEAERMLRQERQGKGGS